jgi:hypothetical protein
MPVPCVPVDTAPAIACASTSPWFDSASPWTASRSPSAWIDVPAITVAWRAASSTSDTPVSPASDTRVWSVATTGENECPLPATRSLPPREAVSWTRPTSASMLVGREIRCGVQRTSPDQFVQLGLRPNTAPMVSGAHAKQKPSPRYVGTRSRPPSGVSSTSSRTCSHNSPAFA